MSTVTEPIVDVTDLHVEFLTAEGVAPTVDGVSFQLRGGESLGIVGESGSGKSLTALSLASLTPPTARVRAGRLRVAGVDLLSAGAEGRRGLLREQIGFIFQNPMTALNPRLTVGQQLASALAEPDRAAARTRIVDSLDHVGVPDPLRRLGQFPHELSGGLAQRAVIALALLRGPKLLIADEPTTALDVKIQQQILDLLDELRRSLSLAVILVSHDLAVVSRRTERLLVMRKGRIVEQGPTDIVLGSPTHDYTRSLLAVIPDLDGLLHPTAHQEVADLGAGGLLPPPPFRSRQTDGALGVLVRVQNVSKEFGRHRRSAGHLALDDVSLELREGESLGLVGESGSGKTTLARIIVGLESATAGRIEFGAVLGDETHARRGRKPVQRGVQYVFQDSSSSLDPHLRVRDLIAEFLDVAAFTNRTTRTDRVVELLEEVELSAAHLDRYPRQLSGGQRQRIGIARALAADPLLLVADEPVSALDVSVQAAVINLLNQLRVSRNLTSIVISHDIGVIAYLCNRVAVLKDGALQEQGLVHEVIRAPKAPYTRALIDAVPTVRETAHVAR